MKKLLNYLRSVRVEMSKVTWPPRDQLVESTGITLFLSTLVAVFIFIVDKVISGALNFILYR